MKAKYWTIKEGKVVQVQQFKTKRVEFIQNTKCFFCTNDQFEYPVIKATHQRSAVIKFIRLFGWNPST